MMVRTSVFSRSRIEGPAGPLQTDRNIEASTHLYLNIDDFSRTDILSVIAIFSGAADELIHTCHIGPDGVAERVGRLASRSVEGPVFGR